MTTETQLSELNQLAHDIKAKVDSNHVFEVLNVIRDEVNNLSRQHDAIRNELRDGINLLLQQNNSTGAD